MPYYKPFAGYHEHFGELQIADYRTFVSEVETGSFILLHVFGGTTTFSVRKAMKPHAKKSTVPLNGSKIGRLDESGRRVITLQDSIAENMKDPEYAQLRQQYADMTLEELAASFDKE